jgi:hypothetical protein
MKLNDCKNRERVVTEIMCKVAICHKNNIWDQLDNYLYYEINADVYDDMMQQIYHPVRIFVNRHVCNNICKNIYETN